MMIYKGMSGSNLSWMLEYKNPTKTFCLAWYVSDTWYECGGPVETTLNWVHLVGTYDDDKQRLYRNGTLVQTSATGIPNPPTTTDPLEIGEYFTYYFNGSIDDVRIYNRVLNATEVTYSYNNGLGTYAPLNSTGLVGWWKFDEGSGNVYDRSGNGNHGTLINGTAWTTGEAPDWYSINQFYIQPNYVGTLSSPSYLSNKLTFTVSAPSGNTSITKVYCGNKGKPERVTGATYWSYNSATHICTVTVIHSNSKQVVLDWNKTPTAMLYGMILAILPFTPLVILPFVFGLLILAVKTGVGAEIENLVFYIFALAIGIVIMAIIIGTLSVVLNVY